MNRLATFEILVFLAVTFFIQYLSATFLPYLLLLDLSLIVVTYIGWNSDPVRGAAAGTLFGLCQDFVLLSPYLGLHGLTLTLIGFVASYLSRYVLLEGKFARFMVLVVFTVFNRVAVQLTLWLLDSSVPEWSPIGLALGGALTGIGGAVFFEAYDRFRVPRKDFRKS